MNSLTKQGCRYNESSARVYFDFEKEGLLVTVNLRTFAEYLVSKIMHTRPLGLKLLTISQPYLNLHKKWLSHAQILKYTWFLAVGLKAKTTFDEKASCFLL